MDISSDKLAKSHMKKPGHGYEYKTLRETESLLIVEQNYAIRNHSGNANSKCRLYGDKYETINQIACECCKLAQKDTTEWGS